MPAASATDEPPYFCTTMLLELSRRAGCQRPRCVLRRSGVTVYAPARRCATTTAESTGVRRRAGGTSQPGSRWTQPGSAGRRVLRQHLLGRGDLLGVEVEIDVEPVVGDHRQQRVERGAGEVAPRGDVGELPPPQRLERRCPAGSAAGRSPGRWRCWSGRRRAGSRPRRARRGRRRSRRCRRCRAGRPAAAASRRGRRRGRRRAGTPLAGVKSCSAPSRAPASSTWLISRSSSEMARPPSASRAIARRASRKLSTWSAICWANSAVSLVEGQPARAQLGTCVSSVIRPTSFLRTRGRG